MPFEDVSLLRKLQNRLDETLNFDEKVRFQSNRCCQKPLMNGRGIGLIIARREDNKNAKYIGLSHCGNAWFCPVCAPRIANEQAKNIAVAVELEKSLNHTPVMLTLTIANLRSFPLSKMLLTLKKAWSYLMNSYRYKSNFTAFAEFRRAVPIHHYIKACEITYSFKNGWHPHLHTLFFVDADKIDLIESFEKALAEQWQNTCKNYMTKYLADCPEIQSQIENCYAKSSQPGLYFSKDAYGKIRTTNCESYITGWKVDAELTHSEMKIANDGHYSLMQLIAKAVSHDEDADRCLELVKTVMRNTKGKYARFSWSRTGLKARTTAYLKQLGEREFKKNFMGKDTVQKWYLVAYIPQKLLERCLLEDKWHIVESGIFKHARDGTLTFEAIAELFTKNNLPEPERRFYGELHDIIQAAA